MKDPRPKTIFLDIDGTIYRQLGGPDVQMRLDGGQGHTILPGVRETLREWDKKGYIVVLVTGRKESMRKRTEEQLAEVGISFDQLVMGIGGGVRVLINNDKEEFPKMKTAIGITVPKNKGLDKLSV